MAGPMRHDPRFATWLSQQAPSRAPHDLLERSMHEIEGTTQLPMHRSRMLFAGLSLGAVAAAVIALAYVASHPSPPAVVGPAPSASGTSTAEAPQPTAPPSRSPAATPQSAEVVARIPLPNPDPQTALLDQIAVIDGTIWTAGIYGQELVQIDSRSNRVVSSVAIPPSSLIVSDAGELWTLSPVGGAPGPANFDLSRVVPASGAPQKVIDVPATSAVAVGFNQVWTPDVDGGLTGWNLQTGERERRLAGEHVDGLTIGCGSLWIWRFASDGVGWDVDRIDPASGAVLDQFELPDGVEQRLVDIGGTCWTDDGASIYGMARDKPLIETEVQPPGHVHLTSDSAWVLDGSTVRRVDLVTGRALGPGWELPEQDVRIGVPKIGADWHLLSADGSLWLLRNDEIIRYAIPTS